MVEDTEILADWPPPYIVPETPVASHPTDGRKRIAVTPYWRENNVCEEPRIREMNEALVWRVSHECHHCARGHSH
jgi:hypothetical protein